MNQPHGLLRELRDIFELPMNFDKYEEELRTAAGNKLLGHCFLFEDYEEHLAHLVNKHFLSIGLRSSLRRLDTPAPKPVAVFVNGWANINIMETL